MKLGRLIVTVYRPVHVVVYWTVASFLLLLLTVTTMSQGPELEPEPLINDAFYPPPGLKYGNNSLMMIGSVAASVILLESDGSIDPSTEDWTAEEMALVHSEIVGGATWWAAREPKAELSFHFEYHLVATSYEPITRPHTDDDLWIAEAMAALGYNQLSVFQAVDTYNSDLREQHQTDWAFTIFVVDSSNDEDNKFSNGRFAYAYIGGPFTVMTYGNGSYGPGWMDMVCAHEVGHIFHALDQIGVSCAYRSGCANVPNRNSNVPPGCAVPVPSIMKFPPAAWSEGLVDRYARGQVGWWDINCNGIFDCIDPNVEIDECTYIFLPVILNERI